MKHSQVTILLLFIFQFGFAQFEIKGKVNDKKGALAYANVILKDSIGTVKKYDVTDENGDFLIIAPNGTYSLEVDFLGFKTWAKEINLEDNIIIPTILLEPSSEEIEEVVIKARKLLIEQKTDRIVYNVENSIAAQGGNALDAIRTAPGIALRNETLEILGKGTPGVMLNGKLLPLQGSDLITFLNSFNAGDIKSVEIISNPPAKYEAQGEAGLINIVLKSGVNDFWKNSTTTSYTQAKYNSFALRNSFLYNKKGLSLNIGLGGELGNRENTEDINRAFSSGVWKSREDLKQSVDNVSGHILIDYNISEKTTVGVQYLGNGSTPNRTSQIRTDQFSGDDFSTYLLNNGTEDRYVDSHSYQAYIETKLDTLGRKLYIDVDYFNLDSESSRDFKTDLFTNTDDFIEVDQSANNIGNQYIDNYNVKVDIEHPMKFMELSYGGKLRFTKTFNEGLFFDKITGTPVFDPSFSNEFDYDENVQSLYFSSYKKISDKLKLQVGLRFENTETKGVSRTIDETTEINYQSLFPTFYLVYDKNEDNSFLMYYGKRINRPGFRELNPFRYYSNSFTYSVGNPFLQPSFTHDLVLGYTYKRNFNTRISGKLITDGYGFIFQPNDETNESITVRDNYFTKYAIGLSQDYTYRKISWWQSQNHFSIFKYINEFDENFSESPKNGVQAWLRTNNTFSFGKSSKFQLDVSYNFPYKDGLFDYGDTFGFNLGYSQSIFNEKFRLSLYVNDLFDTNSVNNVVSTLNGVEVNYSGNYANRFFRCSLSYNFGNKKINNKNKNFGSDDIKNRSGN